MLDVMLTGLSILLEFWALVALRVREPDLARPFRVPGGMAGAVAIGVPPLALMIAAFARNRTELVGSTNELVIGIAVIAAGVGALFSQPACSAEKRKYWRDVDIHCERIRCSGTGFSLCGFQVVTADLSQPALG